MREHIAENLKRSLPAESVLTTREELRPYECDGLSAYRETPLLAAIPSNETEVAAIMTAARETKTPVVARGSGTGLSGGALPLADGMSATSTQFHWIYVRTDIPSLVRAE